MTYAEFMALPEDQREAAYLDSSTLEDREAELASFRTENEQLRTELQQVKEENRKTKELNFALARKTSAAPKRKAEDVLHDMFKK